MSRDVTFQSSLYIGINLENILYGIELVLYVKTMRILLGHGGKRALFYVFFSSKMFALITVWLFTKALFGGKMWIQGEDYPGGPYGYWETHVTEWYMDFGRTAVIVLQLTTDALMIYRCWIVWNSYRIIVVPSILWVATLGLGIMINWTSSSPGGDFFDGLASIFGLSYYSVSTLLNTIVTCIICYRMVSHGIRMKKQLGREYACTYFDVVSIIVESVLPYTLSGIAFMVSLGIGSQTSVAFLSVNIMLMCISPQMLILRVIVKRAWNEDSDRPQHEATTVKFSPADTSTTSRPFEANAVTHHLQSNTMYLSDGKSEV
ncbi:hypothetical protein BU15DRAFT_64818 [Melanogaster broomeanus]|nr:hypothetical protein BU15DRAFT_64818 [Melanogaster broomeanus]